MKPSERIAAAAAREMDAQAAHGVRVVHESAIHGSKIEEIVRVLDDMMPLPTIGENIEWIVLRMDQLSPEHRRTMLALLRERYEE